MSDGGNENDEERSSRFAEFASRIERSGTDGSSADDENDQADSSSAGDCPENTRDNKQVQSESNERSRPREPSSYSQQPSESDSSSANKSTRSADDSSSWEWFEGDDGTTAEEKVQDQESIVSAQSDEPRSVNPASAGDPPETTDESLNADPRLWSSDDEVEEDADPVTPETDPSTTNAGEEPKASRSGRETGDRSTENNSESRGFRASARDSHAEHSETPTEKRHRLWKSDHTSTKDESDTVRSGSKRESEQSPSVQPNDYTKELLETAEYQRPSGLTLEPGTSILVQCGSQDDRKHAACMDLLGFQQASHPREVLLIRYRKLDQSRVARIAEQAATFKIISVGYSQPIPEGLQNEVESVKINNPSDIKRLGIVVAGTIEDWKTSDRQTVVCFHSLNVIFEYSDIKSSFRFLHVFIGMLQGADTVSHFHVDPIAGDSQNVTTVKPLFDEVVSVDSVGVGLE